MEAMPGIERMSISNAVEEAGEAHALGIPAVLLFGVPAEKDEQGSGAYDDEGVVQLAVRAIKEAHPDLLVITDVCLCAYTSHGHCGVVLEDGTVDNDLSLELLAKTAISHAHAGADAVAPSDMMDGRVGALRAQLDAEGYKDLPIVAYSAKFASAFYGPFREAAGSAPSFGDRRSYQMDPANSDEAVREALLDVEEGADMVMVKPALPYLDVIRRVKDATRVPGGRLQRERRVRDGQGRRRGRLPRRGDDRARVAHRDPARGSRHRDHLPREGRGPVAQPIAKVRSRRDGSADPARRARQAAAQPASGQLPDRGAPVRARGRPGGRAGGRGSDPNQAAGGRADHPRGHADLRHARARLQLDAGGGEGRPREPLARGEGHQLASRGVAQLPPRPRLQHLVHDRDRARLGARARRHAGGAAAADRAPSRSASCPRCGCSRSGWTSRWRRAPTRSRPSPRRSTTGSRRRSSCPTSTSR